MYLFRHDASEALALWVFQRSTPEEWDSHFEHLRELATWSGKTNKRAAAILVAADLSRPDAKRKAELARLTEAAGYDPYVAFVSPNVAARAILAMFGWVQRAPRYEMDFFGSSNSALAWLEKRRMEKLVRLGEFLTELRAEYKEKTGVDLA